MLFNKPCHIIMMGFCPNRKSHCEARKLRKEFWIQSNPSSKCKVRNKGQYNNVGISIYSKRRIRFCTNFFISRLKRVCYQPFSLRHRKVESTKHPNLLHKREKVENTFAPLQLILTFIIKLACIWMNLA